MPLGSGLTNDLLPFATGAGSNVLPQSSWVGLPGRLTGFVSGVAESAHLNKAWRQAAFSSAMIGQFTANNSLEDVLDDGSVDEYERKFKLAVRAIGSVKRASLGGTASAATIAFTPPFTSLSGIFFLADVTIPLLDGASLTVDSQPPKPLLRDDGTPIQQGDAPLGAVLFVAYDGTGLRVLNMNPYAVQSGSTNYAPQAKVSGTANSVALAMVPPATYYREGAVYRFKPILANTGPTVVSLNGLASKPLTEMDGTPLSGGELVPGVPMWIQDGGASFLFLRFSTYLSDWAKRLPGFFYSYATNDPATNWTTLVASVWTKINVTIEQVDAEGWYDPSLSRYTPQKTGYYYFVSNCSFGSMGAVPDGNYQASHGVRVIKNSQNANASPTNLGNVPGNHYAGAGGGARGVATGVTYANGTSDYYELYAYQDLVSSAGTRRASSAAWAGWYLGR
jgi:hypothetical protein